MPTFDINFVGPGWPELIAGIASLRCAPLDGDRGEQRECGFLGRRVAALADLLLVVDEHGQPDEENYGNHDGHDLNSLAVNAGIVLNTHRGWSAPLVPLKRSGGA